MKWRSDPYNFCPLCKSAGIRPAAAVRNFTGPLALINYLIKEFPTHSFQEFIDFHFNVLRTTGNATTTGTIIHRIASRANDGDAASLNYLRAIMGVLEIPGNLGDYLDSILAAVDRRDYVAAFGRHCRTCGWAEPMPANGQRPHRWKDCPSCNWSHKPAELWEKPGDIWMPPDANDEVRSMRFMLFNALNTYGLAGMLNVAGPVSDWFEERGIPEFKAIRGDGGAPLKWRQHEGQGHRHFLFSAPAVPGSKLVAERAHNATWFLGFPPGSLHFTRAAPLKRFGPRYYGTYNRGQSLTSWHTERYEAFRPDGLAALFDVDEEPPGTGGLFNGMAYIGTPSGSDSSWLASGKANG